MEMRWTRTPAPSSLWSARTSGRPDQCVIWFRLNSRKRTEEELHPELLNFLVVILAIEDVPLLRAFEDGPFLALDFLAGGHIDLRFLHEQRFENLAGFLPDGIGIFDELNFIHLLQHVRNGAGQHVNFVAAE